jgi:hypothetical protein
LSSVHKLGSGTLVKVAGACETEGVETAAFVAGTFTSEPSMPVFADFKLAFRLQIFGGTNVPEQVSDVKFVSGTEQSVSLVARLVELGPRASRLVG